MYKGKIVEINRPKGYGFIETGEGTRVFFHQRWLKKIKFSDLNIDTEIAFSVNQGPRGPRAFNILFSTDIPLSKKDCIAELLFKD